MHIFHKGFEHLQILVSGDGWNTSLMDNSEFLMGEIDAY